MWQEQLQKKYHFPKLTRTLDIINSTNFKNIKSNNEVIVQIIQ